MSRETIIDVFHVFHYIQMGAVPDACPRRPHLVTEAHRNWEVTNGSFGVGLGFFNIKCTELLIGSLPLPDSQTVYSRVESRNMSCKSRKSLLAFVFLSLGKT